MAEDGSEVQEKYNKVHTSAKLIFTNNVQKNNNLATYFRPVFWSFN